MPIIKFHSRAEARQLFIMVKLSAVGATSLLWVQPQKRSSPIMTGSSYFSQHSSIVIKSLVEDKTKLYPHQKEGLLKILDMGVKGELLPERRRGDGGAAFLLVGVGCGKTVILQATPYLLGSHVRGRQVIFLSDNCTLRQRVMDDFPTKKAGKQYFPDQGKWPLYKYGLLNPGTPPPQIAELKPEINTYKFSIDKADILVVNRQFLINLVKNVAIDPQKVGLIVVDEAHHSAAATYRAIFNYFNQASLVFLTGTRHRGDGEPLPFVKYEIVEEEEENGRIVTKRAPRPNFEFTIQDAWKLDPPIIKKIAFSPARSEGFKVEEDGEEREYTAQDFFIKAETDRQWFRQCILANSFCEPVLDRAVEVLELKRQEKRPHRMIIRALNIPHAERLHKLCQNYDLLKGRVGLIHSQMDEYDSEGRPSDVLEKFYKDEYIALIHVSMVGEGFNEPYASVSVPLCVMRSIQKAEQEFGRIIRKVEGGIPENDADFKAENLAVVVTHEALGIAELFEKFKAGEEATAIEDDLEEEQAEVGRSRFLTDDYHAGHNLLHINSTDRLEKGDQLTVKTYDSEGREKRYYFSVEEIIGEGTLQVAPVEENIPKDSLARKSSNIENSSTQFKGHVGLEWYLFIDGEYVTLTDYCKKEAVRRKGFKIDENGEIARLDGKKIKDFGPELYQLALEGIAREAEKIEIPYTKLVSCRPDREKEDLQKSYLKKK
nr:DEAD/DEAH box helicase family protein [Laspinema sp. D3a]